MDNFVGKRLDGRYEIQEIIGVGGMSVVYKAYDNIDDRIVAVKILKDEFLANEEFRRRFKNESKAIAVLNHPNIVRVYDVNFGERLQYIVMEHVDGITLKEYIQRQGAVNWKDAVHFTTQILRALQHAHDKGIVHRDIKPQNIVLLQNGTIKVTDFGIARFSRSDTRTMTEKAIGSVHYISPEQARGDMTDEKADIYSVGVVLYEMVTGQVPFEADSAVSVAIMQLQAEPKLPRSINTQIPVGLEQIIMHAMQKHASDRYQTATEMLLDIDELNRNPNAVFDYSYTAVTQPMRFVADEAQDAGADDYGEEGGDSEEYYDDYDENEVKAKKKKMIAVIAGGTLTLIAAVVILVMSLTGNIGGNRIAVPEFTSKIYETDIKGKYGDFKFEVTFEESTLKEGSVISQDPEAKTKVKKGTTVNLVVAVSSEEVEVPDVYGMELEAAKAELKKVNLINIQVLEITSDEIKDGSVISTSPARRATVSAGDKITIYVSMGNGKPEEDGKKLTMPDLSGLARGDVEKYLKGAGFTNYTIKEENSEVKKGQVISQTPSKTTKINKDTAITVVVSNGIPPTTVTITSSIIQIIMPKHDIGAKVIVTVGDKILGDGGKLSGNNTLTYTYEYNSNTSTVADPTKVTVKVEIPELGFSDEDIINVTSNDSVTFDASKFSSETTTSQPANTTTKPVENGVG